MCAAGGGKTTRIVREAIFEPTCRAALITYTKNNEQEIERKFYDEKRVLPAHVEVMTWFAFLLRELARPYRRALHGHRIDGLVWVEGRSVKYVPETNTSGHYFAEERYIYSDKISKFICECNRLTGGAVMRRLAQRFDHIFVDEIQDVAGYDLDVLELMLKAGIRLTLVGDHRQATFRTNYSNRHAGFTGANILKKFEDWGGKGLATLSHEQHTYRCNQDIADLGDSFFPLEPPTKSLNAGVSGHDGIFIVGRGDIAGYLSRFAPQILRLDKRTPCPDQNPKNFGESKGLTFDRVLIFPHGLAKKWLASGDLSHVSGSLEKMYVGATRARFSVAFAFDGTAVIRHAKAYAP